MPDFDDDDTTSEDEDDTSGPRGLRQAKKAAETRAAAAEAQVAEAQSAVKELAFLKAGIEESKQSAFFMSHYDGPFDPDSIKQAAMDAGVIAESTSDADQSTQGQNQMAQAMAGGQTVPVGSITIGPRYMERTVPAEEADMWSEYEAALKIGPMGAQAGAEVLARYGHTVGGIDTEMLPGGTSPQVDPR